MDISPDPLNLPTFRRGSTTVLANIVLALAAPGFLVSTIFLVRAIYGATASDTDASALIHSAFSVLSKIALWVVGVFLIRRLSQARVMAAAGFAISLIDSVYYIKVVLPPIRAGVNTAMAAGLTFGSWFSAVLAAVLYAVILVYLNHPASRQEFRRGNG